MMLPNSLLRIPLDEAALPAIKRKQASVTRLFPTFHKRVRAVKRNGGVTLFDTDPTVWHFEITSGTTTGTSYIAHVKFMNLKRWLRRAVADKRLWKKGTNRVDLKKVADLILNKIDLRVLCTCPAFQYWGPAYILSLQKYKAKYGSQERRPPRIRNPKQYGALCKHMHLLLKELPNMTSKFANFLREYYTQDIERYRQKGIQQAIKFKRAGEELGKRKEETEAEEEMEYGMGEVGETTTADAIAFVPSHFGEKPIGSVPDSLTKRKKKKKK